MSRPWPALRELNRECTRRPRLCRARVWQLLAGQADGDGTEIAEMAEAGTDHDDRAGCRADRDSLGSCWCGLLTRHGFVRGAVARREKMEAGS